MKKHTCRILAAVLFTLLLPAPKGIAADSAEKTVQEKPVSEKKISEISAAEIENMSDEQLIREVYKENKFDVAGFRMPDDFGVGLRDGELWHRLVNRSVSSARDAENEIKSFVSVQSPSEYTADYIGENACYYEFLLKYARKQEEAPDDVTSARVIVYKESAVRYAFNDKTGYSSEIRALDAGSVLYLLDLDAFFDVVNWSSARVIHREFRETGNKYIYTYYRVSVAEGDWDIDNSAVLEKIKYGIDKAAGIKTYYNAGTVLKTAEIKGTAKKLIIIE